MKRCAFCDAEATETLHFCVKCMNDPYVPTYVWIKVAQEDWETFSRWKEAWMEWWWIEGRKKYKNPLKANGKPKKEKWVRLFCTRSEENARLMLRQIKAARNLSSPNASQQKELDSIRKYDDFRVTEPEVTSSSKRVKTPKQSEDFRKTDPSLTQRVGSPVECPGCGTREALKVKRKGEKMWRCLSCGRRWPRNPGEGSDRPSKRPAERPGRSTAPERPRKRQKPARNKG